jgi:hypothetical protein
MISGSQSGEGSESVRRVLVDSGKVLRRGTLVYVLNLVLIVVAVAEATI